MKVLDSAQMREVDRLTIEKFGICGLALMERAGVAVARVLFDEFEPAKVLIIAGVGNNGGDGFVVARECHNAGLNVKVVVPGSRAKMSEQCKAQYGTAKALGIDIEFKKSLSSIDFHGATVVDALFGTGLNKALGKPYVEIISQVNASGMPVLSVDIPSGVSSDTGDVQGVAINADITVSFGAPKVGHLFYPGAGLMGRLFVEDIGFPPELFDAFNCNLLMDDDMLLLLPSRYDDSHKGDYGHVLALAGSAGKVGAARMTAEAALMAGAGLVTLAMPKIVADLVQAQVTEEMVLGVEDTGRGTADASALEDILGFITKRADVLAIGPGLGRDSETAQLVRGIVLNSSAPMIIDADALVALAGHLSILRQLQAPAILTPHTGEFSKLTGMDASRIEADRLGTARDFATKHGVWLVLKGAPTIVATPEGETFINTTGNPGMAKAGSGDVLTGILAALLAQGLSPTNASSLGVYLHGMAADVAADQIGMRSMLASDISLAIAEAYRLLDGGEDDVIS